MLEANPGVTETSAPAPTPSADAPAAPETTNTIPTPTVDASGNPTPPAFTPDWKFKVKDKEFEIEPWAREGVKDEETYKKLKRVWERHQGLDEVVSSRDALKKQFDDMQPTIKEYQQVVKNLNEISHYYNSGDLDSFFAKLQIPFEVVFNYVKQKHLESQQSPEVQRELERARQDRQNAYNYKQRLEELEQTRASADVEQKQAYIDSVIASKAQDVATKFNETHGHPLAFRNYVIFKGQQMSTKDYSAPVEAVVDQVVKELARLMGPQGEQTPPNPQMPSNAPANPGQGGKPPVIPNVKAGSQSPVRQPPKSIADLKKLAEQM